MSYITSKCQFAVNWQTWSNFLLFYLVMSLSNENMIIKNVKNIISFLKSKVKKSQFLLDFSYAVFPVGLNFYYISNISLLFELYKKL